MMSQSGKFGRIVMTDELRQILLYRFLMLVLFAIMSAAFLMFPLDGAEKYPFQISLGLTLIILPLMTIIDINELLRATDEPK